MSERKITVRLTVDQWNALARVARGELESYTTWDEDTQDDDLAAAVRVLEDARKKAATR